MGSQEVVLTWEGHHRTMISVFEMLLESSSLVDCTIVAEGRQQKAHKEVLLAFSPYFQILFEDENDKNPTIILSGFTFLELSALINYMYHGKVKVPEERVKNIIEAAQSLQIRGLGDSPNTVSPGSRIDQSTSANLPPVSQTQRRFNNGKDCASQGIEPVDTCAEINSHTWMDSQSVQLRNDSLLQPNGDEAGINLSNHRLSSVENRDSINSNLSSTENEFEVIPKHEEVNVYESSTISCENKGGSVTILGLSTDIGMVNDRKVCVSLPLKQVSLDLPSVSPAVPSLVVNSRCSSNIPASSSKIEQSCNMNVYSSSENPLTPSIGKDELVASELMLKVEPEDDYFSEEATMTEEFGREMETDLQEQNCGAENAVTGKLWNGHRHPASGSNNYQDIGDADPVNNATAAASDLPHRPAMRVQVKSHTCPFCNKVFSSAFNLNRHTRTHTGEKPFKCSLCNYAGADVSNFTAHQRRHTGNMPFKCFECEYATFNSAHFALHRRRHAGDKCFECPDCEYVCADASALVVHRRRHTGEKPYRCSECDYACAVSSALAIHRRRHTGEKPFKCSECEYACAHGGNLTVHRRRHHGDGVPERLR